MAYAFCLTSSVGASTLEELLEAPLPLVACELPQVVRFFHHETARVLGTLH